MLLKSYLVKCLFAIALLGALYNNDVFGPSTLSAYFFYVIPTSILAIIAGTTYLLQKQRDAIKHPLPMFFVFLLVIYYFFNGFIHGNEGGINLRHYFILCNFYFLASILLLRLSSSFNLTFAWYVMVFTIVVEAIVCMLQKFHIVGSKDDLLAVTGTWVNPNVTAMYLAMTTPITLYYFFRGSKLLRSVSIIALVFILLSLILLGCRTAIIGTTIAVAFVLFYQLNVLVWLKKYCTSVIGWISISVVCIAIVVASVLLYNAKQSSSQGRQLIWKICLTMVAQKPLFGGGYGQFEHDYNLAQASYFKLGFPSKQEVNNADYVRMAYNEPLENAVEGGIIGLVLFVGLFGSLLVYLPRRNGISNTEDNNFYPFAYAGVACFAVMGLFNFTVQAIPVMLLFVVYIAFCIVGNQATSKHQLLPIKIAIPITCIAVLSFFKLTYTAKAYRTCKTTKESVEELGTTKAINKLASLETELHSSVFYWRSYGSLLYQQKKYQQALEKYKNATEFSSDPELLSMIGACYLKIGNYATAAEAYNLMHYIQPHHFAPRYALMKTYSMGKDSSDAIKMAHEIIVLDAKIPSAKVTQYKTLASQLIQQYQVNN